MSRKLLALLAAPALAASLVSFVDAPAPPRDVVVVQANLQDALRSADARDTRDLDNFVTRLVKRSPAVPDALLLAEVLGPGAHRVATRLSAAYRGRYDVAVAPGRSAFAADGSVRETAIIVNTGTLGVTDAGFRRIQSEDQAYATVRQTSSGQRLRLVAGHIGGDPAVAAARFHALGADGGATPVLGVDLRLARCVLAYQDAPVDCAPQPFWTTMTDTYAYADAAYEQSLAQGLRHSGYVFTPGAVRSSYVDKDLVATEECKDAYDAGKSHRTVGACRTEYYADSPFTVATVGAPEPVRRVVLPRAVSLGNCEFGTRVAAMVVRIANRTADEVTDPVTATSAAPISVDPGEATLTAPPGEARRAVVRVTAPQDTPPGRHEVTVRVGPAHAVVPVTIPEGECVEPAVFASSFNPGHPPENAIDGDIATFWHTEWSPPDPLPQSLTLNLGTPKTVSELRYHPRFDGNLNGTIRDYVVYTSTDGRAFTEVTRGTWPVDAREKTATFPATEARYVRLEAHSASGGSYASGAEVSAH